MFIVITGLDGSGTSSVAKALHKIDSGSSLVRTPSSEYEGRKVIDTRVRQESQMAHYLYYLSSVVYMSDYIKNNLDYKTNNVYCVRYLIDTVVSHRVSGLRTELNYEEFDILKPDLTIFVTLPENVRQERISERGKSILDKVLDDDNTRNKFISNFVFLLDTDSTIFFSNENCNLDNNVAKLFSEIKRRT